MWASGRCEAGAHSLSLTLTSARCARAAPQFPKPQSDLARNLETRFFFRLKMPNSCAVRCCHNTKKRTKGCIRFFRFPRDEKLRKRWILLCDRDSNFNASNAMVCSIHFLPSDYNHSLLNKHRLLGKELPRNIRILKEDAVPSINLCEGKLISYFFISTWYLFHYLHVLHLVIGQSAPVSGVELGYVLIKLYHGFYFSICWVLKSRI